MVTFNQKAIVNDNSGNHGPLSSDADFGVASGIEFNADGTKMFVSMAQVGDGDPKDHTRVINSYNLSIPYDVSSLSYAGDSEICEFELDEEDSSHVIYDLELSNDGMKMLLVTRVRHSSADHDKAYVFDLDSPYEISTCTQSSETTDIDSPTFTDGSNAGEHANTTNHMLQSIEINNDGSKLFLLFTNYTAGSDGTGVGGRLLEYNLATPYDLTASSLSLVLNAGIAFSDDTSLGIDNPAGMRFSPDGKRLFITSHAHGGVKRVSQVSLSVAFDTSSFVFDGSFVLDVSNPEIDNTTKNDQPRGISFNASGMKMYISSDRSQNDDEVYEYDLVCPFNIIEGKCPSITENNDRHGLAIAQIEIAKRTIDHSTDTALNRLKWIRRNKDKQNLSNLNIDINFTNERLASLTELVKTTAAKKKTNSDKDQDVFYWSEGSISVGKIGDTSVSSSRKIDTNAITFGSDRFTKNNGIRGLAFRFGKNNVDVGNAGSNLDTDTYNITYYDTSPIKDDTKFLDKIFGIGKLNSDLLTVLDGKKLTAKRNGHQMYGTFRIKDEIKKNNLIMIPYGRLDVGHTILGSYAESGQGAIEVEKQHIRTKKIRAGLSAIEDLSNDKYTLKRHGKLEYVADIDRSSNFKYTYVGDRSATLNDTLHSEAIHNINGEIGIDIVLPDSFSIFLIYERNQAIDASHTDKIHIAIGYLPNKDTNYAFSIEGSENLLSKLELKKNVNGFNLIFNVKDNLTNTGDNREANIALNKVF
tara:strand:- start:275 stop:2536 length:2262 start_codon:yes stop_codon:yes gene_type:complete